MSCRHQHADTDTDSMCVCVRRPTGSCEMLFPSTLNSSMLTQLLSESGMLDSRLYLHHNQIDFNVHGSTDSAHRQSQSQFQSQYQSQFQFQSQSQSQYRHYRPVLLLTFSCSYITPNSACHTAIMHTAVCNHAKISSGHT